MNDQPSPLIPRKPQEHLAFILSDIKALAGRRGHISCADFLGHVNALAEQLPQGQHAINLCGNRYLFLVSFCAVILRGQCNLLPPNKNEDSQRKLAENYPNCYIIHDGIDCTKTLTAVNLNQLTLESAGKLQNPMIPGDHLAAITFTSGSTGDSKPNLKYWHTLVRSSAINFQHMLPSFENTPHLLATVPAQHMWGFETSALLPLFHSVCTSDTKPLFPSDINSHLEQLPEPRILVSTPIHLKALKDSSPDHKPLSLTLCATAPLSQQLADEFCHNHGGILREIYGCSEVGSMAVRETAVEESWQKFVGIHFAQENETVVASAEHLPADIELQDRMKFSSPERFKLAGRSSDMVNIAGKRGSLSELNTVLQNFNGISDGVMLQPNSNTGIGRLTAIVCLNADCSKKALTDYLKAKLDSAFVPRPIYTVETLPREENGKLAKKKLDALYRALSQKA